MFKWGSKSLRFAQDVDNELFTCATRALAKSKYDMTIPWRGGVRTAEQQNELYNDGNSKCDGYKVKSYHQSGLALDVIPVGQNPYTNTRPMLSFAQLMFDEWADMRASGEACGDLHWGGLFGADGWDKPHYEVRR